jgi:hypothetical protein
MLALTTTQAAIVASESKRVIWAIYIYDKNGVGYCSILATLNATVWESGTVWETDTVWDNGENLGTALIMDFDGIELRRAMAEESIISPSEVTFTMSAPFSTLTYFWESGTAWESGMAWDNGANSENLGTAFAYSNFTGGTVFIELWLGGVGYNDTKITSWKFNIKKAEPGYQKLKFVCEDFLQKYLRGNYPNTRLVEDIFPSNRTYNADNGGKVCVPVPFGTAYVPLRDVFIAGAGYLMLGDPANTFTITKVRSPRSIGGKSEWDSGTSTFTQSSKTDASAVNWRVFQAIIADSNNDGVADAHGFWKAGENFYDTPVKFTRSDTATMTAFGDVIEFVLKDMGVPAANINSATFTTANVTYAVWGLLCNGAFWYQQTREAVLAELLNSCHSTLRVGEKIELHVLAKASQKTITPAEILRSQGIGEGSFTYSDVLSENYSDSGYAEWQESGESQDDFNKVLIPAGTTMVTPSSLILRLRFVQDSDIVQTLTKLWLQRKLLREANLSFLVKGNCCALQPDDVITINHANYGGTHDILIDSMKINKDLSIQISGGHYGT